MVLVGYWPLDGDVQDVRGSNNGSNSGVSFVEGILAGKAGKFTASESDEVTVSFPELRNVDLMLSWWMRPSSISDDMRIISTQDTAEDTAHSITFRFQNSELQFWANDTKGWQNLTSGENFASVEWYFVSVVLDADNSTVTAYINSKERNSISNSSFEIDDFSIGGLYKTVDGSYGTYFDGKIQEVRIYDHALTEQEIRYMYSVANRGLHTSDRRSL